jgi:hypothetical protein
VCQPKYGCRISPGGGHDAEDVAAVEKADGEVICGIVADWMITMRVEVEVRPAWSVATQSKVPVATAVVSVTMLVTTAPLRKVLLPSVVRWLSLADCAAVLAPMAIGTPASGGGLGAIATSPPRHRRGISRICPPPSWLLCRPKNQKRLLLFPCSRTPL